MIVRRNTVVNSAIGAAVMKMPPAAYAGGIRTTLGSVILALTSCLRLLLASDGRLLIMLSFANLLLDTGLRTASLEAAQSAVQ